MAQPVDRGPRTGESKRLIKISRRGNRGIQPLFLSDVKSVYALIIASTGLIQATICDPRTQIPERRAADGQDQVALMRAIDA